MNARRLIALYPRQWRERYGEEVLALVEQSGAHGWRVNVDLVRACLGAWLKAPLNGWQMPTWLFAPFLVAGWAGGLALLALLTLWLRPAPIVWRAVVAAAALVAVMARLFIRRFEAGPRALAPELGAFEAAVLIIVTVVAGTLLHRAPPVEGFSYTAHWLLFFVDPLRFGAPLFPLVLAILRLLWPRGYDADAGGQRDRQTPTSTLGLSA